ncbi:TetR/AcrR family transcriptional regulator [Brevundimonas sp. 3P9-tot-E]|jgi:AcrR family transcriptional regulator|uniref:TetR/AcrR family transcriptional regulator n=1 Tax=Brevundimonas TaxID=41275 RepID=UPI001906509A|nr:MULTISPECIES: TetR/AcrR family transcriptional regulator [Brevundimonas]MDA0742894.1 TetR/AcrR family transcriptional regulator [Pseudomonadota bacterium]MBI2249748.1 TetR/AcrR family transcriptional regulator [Brevundimonas diminuta]MBK1968841.1 TetR/AcrR family transcriptional regulator [Brevundimonas diminuta]MDA1321564.1 TetR/AcrR family transcriptional regulator [Pseudomonadota bacterium]MDM8351780.1 TetR/AcrR family transcriptional regulator [Brevundimonas diminuta]
MSETTNKLGHRIRTRGARTRRALLDALRNLLNSKHLGEIRPADVAAAAGVSAPTFYTYFASVEEGLLLLCEEAGEDFQRLAAHIHADWSGERAFEAARAYVLEVLGLWSDHGPVLRVEHMLADMGEPAFAESRIRRLRRLHLALERRIAQAHASGLHPEGLNPRLTSYETANLVESVAAGFELMRRADTPEAIIDTTAHIVVKLTTGR